jgi:hypothetical protein
MTAARLIKLTGIWCAFNISFIILLAFFAETPAFRAVMYMSLGLVLLWIVIGGVLQYKFRDPVRVLVASLPGHWRLKFVLFCLLMALLEEAVTVTMTNLAPLFGVEFGVAYITASGNYLDVVLFHSVVAFVPMCMAWSWLLSRYAFSTPTVFLLFGVVGTLAEISFGGIEVFVNFGFWGFVYGLMIFLPAYSIPVERGAKPPRWWHYPLAMVFPFVSAVVYFVIVWGLGSIVGVQIHPAIHFPPITP